MGWVLLDTSMFSPPITMPCIAPSHCGHQRTTKARSWPEPLTAVGELEGEDAALVEVQLVLVGFRVVQHLHIAALHAHRQPLACRAVPQGEDLWGDRGGIRGVLPMSSACTPSVSQQFPSGRDANHTGTSPSGKELCKGLQEEAGAWAGHPEPACNAYRHP